jgi:hypothetical protein
MKTRHGARSRCDGMAMAGSPTGHFGQTQRSCDGAVGKYMDGLIARSVR